jgi:hypothetical protein
MGGAHLGVGAEDPIQCVDEIFRLRLLSHCRRRGHCKRERAASHQQS